MSNNETGSQETYECPSCDYTSEYKNGVSIHHKHKHGESIAKTVITCEWCGDERYKIPSKIDRDNHHFLLA